MKYSIALLTLLAFTGCTGLTSAGVAEQQSAGRIERYKMSVNAHADAVKSVMETLAKVDRGGMKIDTTKDGKIKSISYTDKLDMAVISKALETQEYREPVVQSVLSEAGDFLLKATNLVVPVASIYYGSKNQIATTEAQVLMNASNNNAQSSMVGSYTGNFQNTTNIDTSTTSDYRSTIDNASTSTTSNTQSVQMPSVNISDTGATVGY